MSSHSFCLILLCRTAHNAIMELEDVTVATFITMKIYRGSEE
jgi:hypothetical protein